MFRKPLSSLLIGFLASLLVSTTMIGNAGEKKTKDAKKETKKDPALILEEKGEFKKEDKSKPSKTYPVKLEAGKIYRIELKSDKFDPYLKLEDDAGKVVAQDDDSAGNLNARIYYKAEKAGAYGVVVASQNRQLGPFLLTVTVVTDRKIASEYPNKVIELKWAGDKAQFKGSLVESDGNALGRYYKVFAITLNQGKKYQIDQRSGDFDSYLMLEDADGKRLAHDDDGGDGVNARLTFAPAKTATYRIVATSLSARKLGSFVFDVALAEVKAK